MPSLHVSELIKSLSSLPVDQFGRWGNQLAITLSDGGRLLAAGNGGSAAQAQHLTAELIGRFSVRRQPLSALALHADTSALTALGNDFGFEGAYARQVEAHGRAGDVLIVLSTSGASTNLVKAVHAARRIGMTTWALTGPLPNPLAAACEDVAACPATCPANVQELHLVCVHLICAALDRVLAHRDMPRDAASDCERAHVPATVSAGANRTVPR